MFVVSGQWKIFCLVDILWKVSEFEVTLVLATLYCAGSSCPSFATKTLFSSMEMPDENARVLHWSTYSPDFILVPYRTHPGRPRSGRSSQTSTPGKQWPTAYILPRGVEKYPPNDNWQVGDVYETEMCRGKWNTNWVLTVCPWHCDFHRLIACDLARSSDDLSFPNPKWTVE